MNWSASDYERIDPRLFRGFLAVAKAGSINKGASLAHLSPSAVSQQLGKLEERLGIALFTRTPTTMVLTLAGQKLVDVAEHWLRISQQLTEQLSLEQVSMEGLVRYSMPESCIHSPHFAWLLERRLAHPGIRLQVALKPCAAVCSDLLAGDVDFGFLTEKANHEPLVLYPFCQESYLWVGAASTAWRFSHLDELVQLPFIRYPGVELLLQRWAQAVFPGQPNPSLGDIDVRGDFNDLRGALAMVRGGLGVTVVPQHVVQAELNSGALHPVYTQDVLVHQQIYIAHVRQRHLPARVRRVIGWFLEMHADLQPVPEEFLL